MVQILLVLQEIFQFLKEKESDIATALTKQGIIWNFIPSQTYSRIASWQGWLCKNDERAYQHRHTIRKICPLLLNADERRKLNSPIDYYFV